MKKTLIYFYLVICLFVGSGYASSFREKRKKAIEQLKKEQKELELIREKERKKEKEKERSGHKHPYDFFGY